MSNRNTLLNSELFGTLTADSGFDKSSARTAIGAVIGTDVQAFDAELAAIASLISAANKLPYFTGSGTAALADFSSFGRTLAALTDSAAGRTALALGSSSDVTFHSITTGGVGSFDGALAFTDGAGNFNCQALIASQTVSIPSLFSDGGAYVSDGSGNVTVDTLSANTLSTISGVNFDSGTYTSNGSGDVSSNSLSTVNYVSADSLFASTALQVAGSTYLDNTAISTNGSGVFSAQDYISASLGTSLGEVATMIFALSTYTATVQVPTGYVDAVVGGVSVKLICAV